MSTYAGGIVDEYGLSFFDTECYPLRKLLGVKAEETDSLYDGQYSTVEMFDGKYKVEKYCELAYLEGASVLGTYCEDFYAGMPALTVNDFGKGKAYYIAADFMSDGYQKIYEKILKGVISPGKTVKTPENVSVAMRYEGETCYVFVMNFNNEEKIVDLPFDYELIGGSFDGNAMPPYGCAVLKRKN